MELDILISKKIRSYTLRMAIGITAILLFLLAGSAGASPPPAILEIDGNEQTSGIGDNCWKEENQTSGLCADYKGKITPTEPLLTTSPFTALLRLPLQEPPEELEFRTFRVTDDDELKESANDVRVWNIKGNALNRYKRPFEREPEFNLSLPPGLYVFIAGAEWKDKGSVSYGFLVQINDPAAVVIAQPANGQCIEPGQEKIIPVTHAIETIIVDNSHHHLGNDVKEDLIPKEPEAVVYEKTFLLDTGFDTPELNLMAKSVSPYEINATEYMDRVYINDVEVGLLNCYFKPPSASLFSMETGLEDDLNKGIISGNLKSVFKINGFPLSDDAFIISWGKENIWTISDPSRSQKLIISKEGGKLNVYPPAYSESSEPAVIKISFDQSLLITGNNTIKITSGSNKDGSNHDDFGISQLTLKGVRKTGWILSGKVLVGDEPIFPARVYVYRHGTTELLSSFETSRTNGSYSLKLPDGEYDVKAEAWDEFSNPEYEIKTIVINNSNAILDFKASKFYSSILPIFLAFMIIPFILPSIIVGFIVAISVYVFTKKRKTAVFSFVLGTLGTCIINSLLLMGITGSGNTLYQFESSLLGFPSIITLSLLLSAGIIFILVAVQIILLNRRKVS